MWSLNQNIWTQNKMGVSLPLAVFLTGLLTLKEEDNLSRQEADTQNLHLFGTFTKVLNIISSLLIYQKAAVFFKADFPNWKAIIQNHNSYFVQSVLLAETLIHPASSCELESPVRPSELRVKLSKSIDDTQSLIKFGSFME